jgi:hypothetical protein
MRRIVRFGQAQPRTNNDEATHAALGRNVWNLKTSLKTRAGAYNCCFNHFCDRQQVIHNRTITFISAGADFVWGSQRQQQSRARSCALLSIVCPAIVRLHCFSQNLSLRPAADASLRNDGDKFSTSLFPHCNCHGRHVVPCG